jgi:hypothetical protein
VRCSPVSVTALLAAACLLSSAAENPAAPPSRTTSFSTRKQTTSVVVTLRVRSLKNLCFLASAAVISIDTARPALTKRDDITTLHDDIAHANPAAHVSSPNCPIQLFFQAGICQFVPLRVLKTSVKSIADYQRFPASRLQRRND